MSHVSVRVTIAADLCEGHALCEAVAPGLFEMGDDDRAHVLDVEVVGDLIQSAREAAQVCPCQAITVVDDDSATGDAG